MRVEVIHLLLFATDDLIIVSHRGVVEHNISVGQARRSQLESHVAVVSSLLSDDLHHSAAES